MSILFPLLLTSLFIMLVSVTGMFFTQKTFGKYIEKNLSLLVSFSAGVFLVVIFSLSKEALFHGESARLGIIGILSGGIVISLLFRILPFFHHHHNSAEENCHHSKIDARRILTSDAIHNIGDGILLATTFSISTTLGIATAISIFVHEFITEVSEFFVLKQAGLSTKKAIRLNLLTSSTILIGALGGYFFLDIFHNLEPLLLGFSAGAFIVIVFHDLLPSSLHHSKKNNTYVRHLLWIVLGIAVMFSVKTFIPEEHGVSEAKPVVISEMTEKPISL
ncbi:MAG: zinc transporter ZupT [Flavobacteriaceae bacterium]|jgi:zinc transporter ZupT